MSLLAMSSLPYLVMATTSEDPSLGTTPFGLAAAQVSIAPWWAWSRLPLFICFICTAAFKIDTALPAYEYISPS